MKAQAKLFKLKQIRSCINSDFLCANFSIYYRSHLSFSFHSQSWPFSSEILHIKAISHHAKKLFIHMWSKKIIYGNNKTALFAFFFRWVKIYYWRSFKLKIFRSNDTYNSFKSINQADDDTLFHFLPIKCKPKKDQQKSSTLKALKIPEARNLSPSPSSYKQHLFIYFKEFVWIKICFRKDWSFHK